MSFSSLQTGLQSAPAEILALLLTHGNQKTPILERVWQVPGLFFSIFKSPPKIFFGQSHGKGIRMIRIRQACVKEPENGRQIRDIACAGYLSDSNMASMA
jgi:hypothetical protein